MNSIGIYHHLGLGDTIECSAIVRKLSEQYDKVYLFAKSKYKEMISTLYKDLNNLEIICVSDDPSKERQDVNKFFSDNSQVERFILGHENYFTNTALFNHLGITCAEAFYYLARIPYSYKYNGFYLERNLLEEERIYNKLNPNNEKYIFIHDDEKLGFKISADTKLKIIKNDTTENLFHMIKVLENAEEIHCMSSSILCLIDSMIEKANFKNLFLHYNVRKFPLTPNYLNKKWTILK
jgi:hypothetical protein